MSDKPKMGLVYMCLCSRRVKMRDLHFAITDGPLLSNVDPYVEIGWTPQSAAHLYNEDGPLL